MFVVKESTASGVSSVGRTLSFQVRGHRFKPDTPLGVLFIPNIYSFQHFNISMSKNIFKKLPFRPFNTCLNNSTFSLELRPVSRTPKDWKIELELAAKQYLKFNKPLFLSLSGGIDSEVMAISFLNAGVPFTPLILKYEIDGEVFNDFDIKYAINFCKKNKLKPLVHSVNPEKFVKMASSKTYAKYNQIAGIYMYVQIYLINLVEEMSGMLVGGGTEQNWRYSTALEFCVRSSYLTAYQYMYDNKLQHWPSFHWTSPELILSYTNHPIVKKAFKTPKDFLLKDKVNELKIEVFHNVFPELERRKKYHGYERFDEIPMFKTWLVKRFYPEYRTYRIPYPEFLQQLKKKKK